MYGSEQRDGDSGPQWQEAYCRLFALAYLFALLHLAFVRDMWSSHSTDEIVLASRMVPLVTMRTAVGKGTRRL